LIVVFGGSFVVRLSMVITAIFFAASAIPLFRWLSERGKPQLLPEGETYLSVGFKRLWNTAQRARKYREFLKFMLAFVVFNDGIIMALDFAAIIGVVLFGMSQEELIMFIIVVQVASVLGAYVFGVATDRWGGKSTLIVSLLLMILAVAWLYVNQSKGGFIVIGLLAGFALTGVQSVSRTMVSILTPLGQSAEFYGLFAVAGRTSSFIGPAVFGLLAAGVAANLVAAGESVAIAEQAGQRAAILSIGAFLMVGMLLLLAVNPDRGTVTTMSSEGSQHGV
jgi:UMF1 family MFS transporter